MLRTIFVVDDHADSAETTADLLRMEGYQVKVFFDGQQSVDAARVSWPDMIFLDINMPVMDGYQAAAILRREGPRSLKLVALTGRTEVADVQRARDAGFDHHLGKPVVGDAVCNLARTSFMLKDGVPAAEAVLSLPDPQDDGATAR